MLIIQKHIFRSDIRNNRFLLYIFGDNLHRTGFGGQAKEMRGEPNSFGFATKRNPDHCVGSYFSDTKECFDIIDSEFESLRREWSGKNNSYKGVVFPEDGIGTGLSKMPEVSPRLFLYMTKELEKFFREIR